MIVPVARRTAAYILILPCSRNKKVAESNRQTGPDRVPSARAAAGGAARASFGGDFAWRNCFFVPVMWYNKRDKSNMIEGL